MPITLRRNKAVPKIDLTFLLHPCARTFWYKNPNSEAGIHDSHRVELKIANQVSSLTERGLHAPVIDLDYPAELEAVSYSSSRLTLQTYMRRSKIVALRQMMIRLGLSPAASLDEPVNPQAPTFVFDCPAHLITSSTAGHHHLYLGREINWFRFDQLLGLMDESGMINHGYYTMAHERGMAILRMPGIYKRSSLRTDAVGYTAEWSGDT